MPPGYGLYIKTLAFTSEGYGAELSQYDTPNSLLIQIGEPHARVGVIDDLLDRFRGVPLDNADRLVILL